MVLFNTLSSLSFPRKTNSILSPKNSLRARSPFFFSSPARALLLRFSHAKSALFQKGLTTDSASENKERYIKERASLFFGVSLSLSLSLSRVHRERFSRSRVVANFLSRVFFLFSNLSLSLSLFSSASASRCGFFSKREKNASE